MAKQQQIPGTGEAPPSALMQARILAEALPHMQRYDRQTVVVKYGGHAMGDPALAAAFAQDIVLLKQAGVNPIVVHGGGPQIAGMLKRLELQRVIAPVAISREGETLNINADTFASALAARMKAKRLLLLTDVAGVLDKDGELHQQLTIEEARKLIREGIITGGMIPKIEGCIEVVEAGVEAVVVIDGRVPHCVLLELFTEHGVGTLVSRKATEQ